jgi:hypothetical protein
MSSIPADAKMDPGDAVPPIGLGMGGVPFLPNATRLYFHFGTPIRTDGFTAADLAVRGGGCTHTHTHTHTHTTHTHTPHIHAHIHTPTQVFVVCTYVCVKSFLPRHRCRTCVHA